MFCWGGHPARQIAILRLHANNVQIGNLAVLESERNLTGGVDGLYHLRACCYPSLSGTPRPPIEWVATRCAFLFA
jgi:hypothetical protein